MLDSWKVVKKQSEESHRFLWHFFPSLKQNFIAYHSSKMSSRPDSIFEIHQLWQSDSSRVYSNYWCSFIWTLNHKNWSVIASHKMYSNNIGNFQESTTILNAWTKNVWKLIKCTTYIFIVKTPLPWRGFDIRSILKRSAVMNSRPIAKPRPKKLVYPTIYSLLIRWID